MRTLDVIEHISAHPEMYLPNGQADPHALAKRLAGDALLLGATVAGYGSSGDWWFVFADKDWVTEPSVEVRDVFSRIVPFPEAGPNAVRTEVLLYAFAKDVVAFVGHRAESIKGDEDAVKAARDMIEEPERSGKSRPRQIWPRAHAPLVIAFRVVDDEA